jgi:hypothetical protein
MRRRRAPMNRKINLRARRRVGSNPNVVGPIGTRHRHTPINSGCPPSRRAGYSNGRILQYGRTAAENNGRLEAPHERFVSSFRQAKSLMLRGSYPVLGIMPMAVLGSSRDRRPRNSTSALLRKSDSSRTFGHVRFGQKPTSAKAAGLSAMGQQHAQIYSVAWLPRHDDPCWAPRRPI